MKHSPAPIAALLFACPIALLALQARAETVEQVVNPKRASNTWVSDMARVLDSADVQKMNGVLNGLQRRTGAEVAVVTVRNTGGLAPKAFATTLFNRWGIGQRSRDNGALLLLVMEARRVEVETGDGMGSILPDSRVQSILNERAVPRFKQGDYSGGVLEATRAIAYTIEKPAQSSGGRTQAQGLRSEPEGRTESSGGGYESGYAQGTHSRDSGNGGFLIPLAGAAVLLPLGGWALAASKTRHCPRCKTKMTRLSEQEDDAHLLFDQKFEEDLGSVDYRVWQCPSCSAITMERAVKWLSGYDDCPQCSRRTLASQTTVLRHATQTRTGESLVKRHCKFPNCNFQDEERRTLPKLPRPTHSSSSHRSSGSSSRSSSSGSFGGGSSSGGGAGASW